MQKSAQLKVLRSYKISKSAQFKVRRYGLNLNKCSLFMFSQNIAQIWVLSSGEIKKKCSAQGAQIYHNLKKVLSFGRSDIAQNSKKCSDIVLR